MRKLTSLLAAIALAATSLAPAGAEARDRHGRYHDRHDHHYNYRDHDDDAVAAGVIGLVLGLAIGSMASEPQAPDCADNYRRCPPPQQGYYDPRYEDQNYDEEDLEGGYDPRYEDPRAAYERDYGRAPEPYVERAPECTRRERQWDRYANRYLMVDVPC